MVRQKSKKSAESPFKGVSPPSSSLAAASRYNAEVFQNSKIIKNNKTNDRSDFCVQNFKNCRKNIKGRNPFEKQNEKTFVNQGVVDGGCKDANIHYTRNKSSEENEKADDGEEFLMMINQAIKQAVEKYLQDLISQSLKDISKELDEIREQVHSIQKDFEKMQIKIINKIIHYGEENSRHFRYLCMKSEYDKMFYQHQNDIKNSPIDTRPNMCIPFLHNLKSHIETQMGNSTKTTEQTFSPQANFLTKNSKNSTKSVDKTCLSNGFISFDNGQRSKLSVSSKSSDMGIREVKDLLTQLQKFYDEHSFEKNYKNDNPATSALTITNQGDSADGDNDDESSDDMTSPSIEEIIKAGGDF